ncbi:MAG: LURP-one-related/scramblase family protein [Planctomycetota bacterium]
MHPVLNHNVFFVKEHVGIFKAANNFDVMDERGKVVLHCREEELGFFTKMLRFTDYKRMTPFHIEIRTPEGELVVQVKRGVTLFLSKVAVLDGEGNELGGFAQKFFSIGGAFKILDPKGEELCMLKGKWTGWEFRGLGKELLTSADNYVLTIDEAVPEGHPMRALIMAAVMCIDMVLKE